MVYACWDFLLYHQRNPSNALYVAEIDFFDDYVTRTRASSTRPKRNWSFTSIGVSIWRLFPSDVPSACRRLIDAGANLVSEPIPIVFKGREYQDGYIVYGLGNFFLPNGVYANGELNFPRCPLGTCSRMESSLQRSGLPLVRVSRSSGHHTLNLIETQKFEESQFLAKHSPYGASMSEYVTYFKKHRRKKRLVPVYLDPEAKWVNRLYTQFLRMRGRTARQLPQMKLRRWQT